MPRPFEQLPYDALPEEPRRAHRYFELPHRDVQLDSRPFGRLRVHLRELGEGEPLLLVHGLMTTGYSWRYVVGPLAERYRVIVPDLVGCGRSDKPDRPYDAASIATFLGELMAELGIRGARVVGNSLGGYLAMRLALADARAMGGLVNIHSPGIPEPRLYALRAALALPGSSAVLDWMIRRDPLRWAHGHVHYRDESLKSREEAREYGGPLRTPEGRRAFCRYLSQTVSPAGMRAFVAELERRDRFPIPLRLLYAREDPMVSPQMGRRLHALVPDAELVWLDDASHFAQVDQPEALVAQVLAFFDDVDRGA